MGSNYEDWEQGKMFGASPADVVPQRREGQHYDSLMAAVTNRMLSGGQGSDLRCVEHSQAPRGAQRAPAANWEEDTVRTQWIMCGLRPAYFVSEYVFIEDPKQQAWIHFRLWPAQAELLGCLRTAHKVVILKARQLGISWLCLSYGLWLMLFRAPSTILLFSLREAEAKEMLERVKRMYERLPVWMQAKQELKDAATGFALSNGSRALAFSTGSGRSYSGTLAIVDEADFVDDLNSFLNAVKPTVDGGGQLFLVSTSNKKRPGSTFKNLFRSARSEKAGDYMPIFLPWTVHPDRDEVWYSKTRSEMFAQRGVDDDFLAEYPATPEDALAAEQLDRRIPHLWLQRVYQGEDGRRGPGGSPDGGLRGPEAPRGFPPDCGPSCPYVTREALQLAQAPDLSQLRVYELPEADRIYVVGADPAEGNPNSDDSALTVLDAETWCEVATLADKVEPAVFADMIDQIAAWYNRAGVMVERNNHGHSVLLALDYTGKTEVLRGYDHKRGWLNNVKGKPLMYNTLVEAVRDEVCGIRSPETLAQLGSIQASDLSAPAGLADDRATAFGLAIAALVHSSFNVRASTVVPPVDVLEEMGW